MKKDASTGNSSGNSSADSGYTEKFPPTSGRVLGVIAVLFAAAVLVYAVVDDEGGFEAPVAWGAALAGILSYAALLRPAVRVESDALVMRNMLDTNVIPLAAIDEVAVRQVMAVRAGEKRYVSPAIGNSFLRTLRPKTSRDGMPELTYPEYVRDRVLHLADGARRRSGDAEPPAVRRTWATYELAGLLVTAVGFALSLLA
ncbi:hypothetical protein ISU10_09800 [Nocardioides agariphilus]|jgi:hypothetical protein|uniref:PH domain-containing protein n=1 Tax=Nocardioides agariphilus TaxID=433664 RepID=A0A930YPV3_9ACTN|nr:hypothetical protein [Nocardioides agariphilus]MBF4768060.1 hypothetical protein [Nocardioides agariphilus]